MIIKEGYMLTEDLKSILNKEQFEAVTYGDGPLLVLAGAGSGKTRVLTYRYAYLVDCRYVPPYNILAITFTNKAAGEMKNRIISILGEGLGDTWIGTFHACCGRILRRHGDAIGYDSHFTIYAESESLETVRTALKHLDLDEKQYPPRMMRAIIGKYKDSMMTPEDVLREAGSYSERVNANVYREYQNILKSSNCMDFDDMILNVVKLFRENQNILDYYRSLFQYILVDEYQDTNRAQHRLVNMLAGRDGNLCVVGDDDQSIYSFRGADIDNILSFEKHHPGAKVIKLEQNYRSTGNILKIANDLIKKNSYRTGKRLWTSSGPGAKAVCRMAADHNEEAEFIAGEIKKRVAQGDASYSDFAVLYRINAVSTGIERVLTRMKIPYRVFGGMKFYDRKEIKDLVAYLRVLANPADEASLRRIINVPKRGIGDTTVDNISIVAGENGIPMFEVIRKIENYPILARSKDKLAGFRDLIVRLGVILADSPTLTEFVQQVIDVTGIALEYENDHTPEGDAKAENIREFLSVTRTFEEGLDEGYESAGAVFPEFLESVSLNTDLDSTGGDDDPDASRVTLTTIHSAKGLEFPVVFIAGLEDGVFPSNQSFEDRGSMDEERRLMYVAVTRAMSQLFLSSCSYRMLYGKTQGYKPSRFLRDIPAEDLELSNSGRSYFDYRPRQSYDFSSSYSDFESVRPPKTTAPDPAKTSKPSPVTAAPVRDPASVFPRFISTPPASAATYLTDVEKGERVRHKKFGDGTVTKVEKADNGTVVEIVFDNAGMKRLILEYAKLQAL